MYPAYWDFSAFFFKLQNSGVSPDAVLVFVRERSNISTTETKKKQ